MGFIQANSFSRHDRAVRATRLNVARLQQHLAELEACIRDLLRDPQLIALLKKRGYKRLPRHIHDAVK